MTLVMFARNGRSSKPEVSITSSVLYKSLIPPFHRGETVERPLSDHKIWQISQRSFSEHSMISKVFHDFSMIMVAIVSIKFEQVQNSLSVVFEGSELSMNAQRSLNERSTVSPVFQWSLRNPSTNATCLVIQWSPLVAAVISVGCSCDLRWLQLWSPLVAADLSDSTIDCTMSAQGSLNGYMLVAQRMLSDHQGPSEVFT